MISEGAVLRRKLAGVIIGTVAGVSLSIYMINPAVNPFDFPRLLLLYVLTVFGVSTVLVTSEIWMKKILDAVRFYDKSNDEKIVEEERLN